MALEKLTKEDLPVIFADRMKDALAGNQQALIEIDLLAATDTDGWCIAMLKPGNFKLKLAASEDLAENGFLSCEGLIASVVAHSWVARTRTQISAALNVGGIVRGEGDRMIGTVTQALALSQYIVPSETIIANEFMVGFNEERAIGLGYARATWLNHMDAAQKYGGEIQQTIFLDPDSGTVAYLGLPERLDNRWAQTPGGIKPITANPLIGMSDRWAAFDIEEFAAAPKPLPEEIYALSEYGKGMWVLEQSDGFGVVLRDRYIQNETTSAVVSFIAEASVPERFLPTSLRFLADGEEK